MLRWRVRVAMRLNHCLVLGGRVSSAEPGGGGGEDGGMEEKGCLHDNQIDKINGRRFVKDLCHILLRKIARQIAIPEPQH